MNRYFLSSSFFSNTHPYFIVPIQIVKNLIIEIKQEANIPLSVSEKKSVMRESEVGVCPGMPKEEQERRLKAAEEIQAGF